MKKMKMLIVISMCCMFMATPVATIRTQAVTVDINDNYDAGLLQEENDTGDTGGGGGGGSSETAPATATPATATTTTTPVAVTTTTTTTDLPRTGDDDRIMLTFVGMLASLSVFLTALIASGKIGKNVKNRNHKIL